LARTELVAIGLSWPAGGHSSFSVYKLSGMTYVQVSRIIWSSWNVGSSDAGDAWFETDDSKSGLIRGPVSHVFFFLLLPNDTSAPCLGGNRSAP
jgi:hypothetical protein